MTSPLNPIKNSNSLNHLKKLEKKSKDIILKKYGSKNPSSLKYQYLGLIMENLIFNKN